MQRYEHTQFGTLVLVLFLVVGGLALAGTAIAATVGADPELWAVGGSVVLVLAVLASLFSTLTVRVDADAIELAFGPVRAIRRSIPLAEIAEVRIVQNKWWYGWGIRLTPHGWLWNVSGFDAVELVMRSGKKFRVGTDEPRELAAALARTAG